MTGRLRKAKNWVVSLFTESSPQSQLNNGGSEKDRELPVGNVDPICYRLKRDADSRYGSPDVRRLVPQDLQNDGLVDEIISLMFGLTSSRGFTFEKLVEELRKKSRLRLERSAFYIYMDRNSRLASTDIIELSENFYKRLLKLIKRETELIKGEVEQIKDEDERRKEEEERLKENAPLRNLVEVYYQSATKSFDPDKISRDELRMFLPCYFSICPKNFPKGMSDWVFIAGRLPIHNNNEIRRWEQRQKDINEGEAQSESSGGVIPRVWYLARVETGGARKDSRVRLNAHKFAFVNASVPQSENELYIGNWRNTIDLSIGAAEHDEIQCPALEDKCFTSRINLQPEADGDWKVTNEKPAGLPEWFKYYTPEILLDIPCAANEVKVCVKSYGGKYKLLTDFITRKEFPQELKLMARVLPDNTGQLADFWEVSDKDFLDVSRDISALVVTAIEVQRDMFWLVRTNNDRVFCIVKEGQRWVKELLTDGKEVNVGTISYLWKPAAAANTYPSWVKGLLHIRADAQRQNFVRLLIGQRGAELPIDGDVLPQFRINPDTTLGKAGIVKLRCLDRGTDGKAIYGLVPVPKARFPFFAFQKNIYSNTWYSYTGDSNGDLRFDEKRQQIVYKDSKEVLAERGSYNLICGTSFFQIKISGTPDIEAISITAESASQSDEPASTAEAASTELVFDPTDPTDVTARLRDTERWGNYIIKDSVGKSDFAAHYTLSDGDSNHFLKAYFGVASAEREAAFYERYREQARQLYIQSPDDILRLSTDEPPWGIIFQLLYPLEEKLGVGSVGSALSLPQAAAIGQGYAKLLKALADDQLINYDIDTSTLCLDSSGRLVIVDFDNTFPMLTDDKYVPVLRSILDKGMLPAKNKVRPPEAHQLSKAKDTYDRQKALRQIRAPYSTFMLAVILLQLMKITDELKSGEERSGVPTGALVNKARSENSSIEGAEDFEKLLGDMLNPDPRDVLEPDTDDMLDPEQRPKRNLRPSPDEVLARFISITEKFAAHDQDSAEKISRLLGA